MTPPPGWPWVICRSRRCRWTPSTARMDLVFFLRERWTEAGEPAGIGGAVEFRTDVFDADSIEALIERLAAGVGGDDRRPDPAAVVDRSARCR